MMCAMTHDTPLTLQILRDTALRFGLAWEETQSIPVAARTASGIRLGAVLDHLRHPGERPMVPGASTALGGWQFFPAENYLKKGDDIIRLTEKERDILLILRAAQGGVVTRDHLLHTVWGYGAGIETHTLETHIYRLRNKIENDPGRAQLLLTEGDGYRLNLNTEHP